MTIFSGGYKSVSQRLKMGALELGDTLDKASAKVLDLASLAADIPANGLTKFVTIFFQLYGIKPRCEKCVKILATGLTLNESMVSIWNRQCDHHTGNDRPMSPSLTIAVKIFLLHFETNDCCCFKHKLVKNFSQGMFGRNLIPEFLTECPEECIAEGQLNSYVFGGILNLLAAFSPFSNITLRNFSDSAAFARSFTTNVTALQRLGVFVGKMVEIIITKFTNFASIVPEDVERWISSVDEILVMYEGPNKTFMSSHESMVKFQKYRHRIYKLYTQGKVFERKFEVIREETFVTKLVFAKVLKLEKIINDSSSIFLGNDKKEKPLLIYLHGSPGVGKTVCIDHIFTDLFAVLQRPEPYNAANDKYCYNSISPFFDTYAHQSVFEVSDFLQMRDKTIDMQEVVNILKCGDESAFPLNMADCSSKGTTFFTSEFLVVTSNVNPNCHKSSLSSVMADPQAFIRRIDVRAEVTRESSCGRGFDKDAIFFRVEDGKNGRLLTYNEFVAHVASRYKTQVEKSSLMTDAAGTFTQERISDIAELLRTADTLVPKHPSVGEFQLSNERATIKCEIQDCKMCDLFLKTHDFNGVWHPITNSHTIFKNSTNLIHACRKTCGFSRLCQQPIACAQMQPILYAEAFSLKFSNYSPDESREKRRSHIGTSYYQTLSAFALNNNIHLIATYLNQVVEFGRSNRPSYRMVIKKAKVCIFEELDSEELDLPEPLCDGFATIFMKAKSLAFTTQSNILNPEERLNSIYAGYDNLLEKFASDNVIFVRASFLGIYRDYGDKEDPWYELEVKKSRVTSFLPIAHGQISPEMFVDVYSLNFNPDFSLSLEEVYERTLNDFAKRQAITLKADFLGKEKVFKYGGPTYLMKVGSSRVIFFQETGVAWGQIHSSSYTDFAAEAREKEVNYFVRRDCLSYHSGGDKGNYLVTFDENKVVYEQLSDQKYALLYIEKVIEKVTLTLQNLTPDVSSFGTCLLEKMKNIWTWLITKTTGAIRAAIHSEIKHYALCYVLPLLVTSLAGLKYFMSYSAIAIGHTDASDELPVSHTSRPIRGPRSRHKEKRRYNPVASGHISPGDGDILMHNIRPNVGILTSKRGNVNVLALRDLTITFVQHVVPDRNAQLLAVFPGSVSFSFTLAETKHLLCEDNHLYIVDLSSVKKNRYYRSFSDITKYFISGDIESFDYDGFLFGAVNVGTQLSHMFKDCRDIRFENHPIRIQVKACPSLYTAEDCVSYTASTVPGDCTAPVMAVVNNKLTILGLHCAKVNNGRCFAGYCSREWIFEALSQLTCPEEIVGQINPEFKDFSTPVEYLGKAPPVMHLSRKTQIRKSPFWTNKVNKVQAPLKGQFNGQTPLEISLSKSLRPMFCTGPNEFYHEKKWLSTIYQPTNTANRMLTLEESIFGSESLGIKSVSGKASVGYPWSKKYTRKDLLNLDEGFIHPALRKSVETTITGLEANKIPEFVVVDLLKDEKLPISKALSGKARIFCVLPLDINLILKMYFGSYVQHVMNLHNTHPVKIGLSLCAGDIEHLSTQLHSNRDDTSYLCGDFSASDRSIPFEIFMDLICVTNEWYNDDKGEQRLLLGRSVFEPVHHCDDLVYRMRQGMPSGLYLTSVFNSLAYAMVFKKVFNTLNVPLLSIATYGDDHVLVVNERERPAVKAVSSELAKYGFTYTGPDKSLDVDWTDLNGVVFLQRALEKRCGIWYFPMNLSAIRDNMAFFRSTRETRDWSEKKLTQNLLLCAQYEFFQHGEQIFDRENNDCLSLVSHKIETLSFDELLYHYIGRGQQPRNLEFSCDPSYGFLPNSTLIACAQMDISTDQTRVGETTVVSDEQNLTKFVELESEAPVVVPQQIPALDSSFEWGTDYSKSLERFFHLRTLTLDNTDPASTPLIRFNPVMELLNEPYIRDRLFQAQGMRFDVEIQIRIVATKFHYGQVMGVFRPGLAQNQIATYFSGSQAVQTQYYWGPYDHVSTASQCPNQVMPVTQGPPTSFVLKWHYPFNWIKTHCETTGPGGNITSELSSDMSKFCMFDLYKLTPVEPSDIDRPQLLIWGRLANVRLFGYLGTPQTTFKDYSLVLPTTIAWGQVDEGLLSKLDMISLLLDEINANNVIEVSRLVSEITEQIADGQMGEKEQMSGTWSNTFTSIVDTITGVVGHVQHFISAAASLGFSHPRIEAGPSLFARNTYPTSNSLGISTAIALSYRSDDAQTPIDIVKEPKTLDHIASIPTFITWKTFTNLDKTLNLLLNHKYTNNFKSASVFTPAGYISEYFAVTRSAIKVYFHFSASAMIAARVTIYATPSSTDITLNYLKVTRTIDLQGDMLEEFDLPYFEPTAYAPAGPEWHINVSLVSDIISPEAANTRPILLAVWIAFPGFEVGIPSVFDGSISIPEPQIAVGQMDSSPSMIGQTSDPGSGNYGLSSSPTSIYHLMKRWSGQYAVSSETLFSYRAARTKIDTYGLACPIWFYLASMYKYCHGSYEAILDAEPVVFENQVNDKADNLIIVSIPIEKLSRCGGVIPKIGTAPLFTIPYRATTPYSFHEYPIFGFHGNETYQRTTYPQSVSQLPITMKGTTIASWPSDDFECFLFIGVPSVKSVTESFKTPVADKRKFDDLQHRMHEMSFSAATLVGLRGQHRAWGIQKGYIDE